MLIPRKESNAMKTSTIKTNAMPNAPVGKVWDEVSASQPEIEMRDCWKKPAVLRRSNNLGLANDILE